MGANLVGSLPSAFSHVAMHADGIASVAEVMHRRPPPPPPPSRKARLLPPSQTEVLQEIDVRRIAIKGLLATL